MDTTTTPEPSPATDLPAVPVMAESHAGGKGLYLIAIFELVKTVLFLIGAAGMFHLVNRDTQIELRRLLHVFRISGDSKFVGSLLPTAADLIDAHKRVFVGLLLLYAVLHATEGLGLLLRKRWAEYFTVIMTAIPLPYEVYLLVHHTTHSKVLPFVSPDQKWIALFSQHIFVLKIFVLLANLGIVYYLIYHLRHSAHRHTAVRTDGHEEGKGSSI